MKFLIFLQKLITNIVDILAPEETKIQKLLNISADQMRHLLPASPVNMSDIFVLFDYRNNIVKLIVKSIKYKNNSNLKQRIASYFYEEIVSLSEDISLFDGSPPIIVPMPMSKLEKRKKGFNQCEEICKDIEKLGNSDIQISYNILKKIRETKRQTTLGKKDRLLNIKNSIHADNKVKNHTIIVIDDVYTTLASFREAERALKQAGAKRAIGLFIAH